MKLGVMLPMASSEGPEDRLDWPDIRDFARAAEQRELDSVWVCDHVIIRFPGRDQIGVHEAWTIEAALAAATSRIELGQLVVCGSFRNPALLAKMAASVDAISGGRLVLGLGAGWHDPEYEAFGWPTDHKAGRFEELLRIVVPLLRGETVSFEGRYHSVTDAVLLPAPRASMPILVAGHGPRMLRLTAEFADAWNTAWHGRPGEKLQSLLVSFGEALERAGRDPASVQKTVGVAVHDVSQTEGEAPQGPLTGSAAEIADVLDEYRRLGFGHVIVNAEPVNEKTLDLLGSAAALLRG